VCLGVARFPGTILGIIHPAGPDRLQLLAEAGTAALTEPFTQEPAVCMLPRTIFTITFSTLFITGFIVVFDDKCRNGGQT
jgi:hypothetical protein